MEYIALLSGIIALANEAVPKIREMFASGQITPEQQQKLLDDINSLRDRLNNGFTGPEWENSGR